MSTEHVFQLANGRAVIASMADAGETMIDFKARHRAAVDRLASVLGETWAEDWTETVSSLEPDDDDPAVCRTMFREFYASVDARRRMDELFASIQ